MPEHKTKEHISHDQNILGMDKGNIITIIEYKAKNMVPIKLYSIITNSRIIHNYRKTPATYSISDHEIQKSFFETVHTN